MTEPVAVEQPPVVDEPKHKLSELTTYELTAYRRQLESAVAFFERTNAPVLTLMQAKLAAAVAEVEDRVRIARAR